MSLLICGTTALDNLIIRGERFDDKIGGSAFHASMASRLFTKTYVSGRIGSDFPKHNLDIFKKLDIDISCVEIDEKEPTFHWTGEYLENFNDRITKDLVIGSWQNYEVTLPQNIEDFNIILLANMSPSLQLDIIEKSSADFYIMDTMNFYIETELELLKKAISRVNMLVINDEEFKMLTGEKDADRASKILLSEYNNLDYLVIKQGSHGARLYNRDKLFIIPACPVEKVNDPTGAGDSFVGALAGFLDEKDNIDFNTMKLAMFYATVASSFNVEGVSIDIISQIDRKKIEERVEFLKDITQLG